MNCSHCPKEITEAEATWTERGSSLCAECFKRYEANVEKMEQQRIANGRHSQPCNCYTCETDYIQSF